MFATSNKGPFSTLTITSCVERTNAANLQPTSDGLRPDPLGTCKRNSNGLLLLFERSSRPLADPQLSAACAKFTPSAFFIQTKEFALRTKRFCQAKSADECGETLPWPFAVSLAPLWKGPYLLFFMCCLHVALLVTTCVVSTAEYVVLFCKVPQDTVWPLAAS